MKRFWNWAREIEWLAVVSAVLIIGAVAVGSLAIAVVAYAPLAVVLGLAGIGLAILAK